MNLNSKSFFEKIPYNNRISSASSLQAETVHSHPDWQNKVISLPNQ